MIQYLLDVIHEIIDVQDTSQYEHQLFIVSDEGISHVSCVPSKLTPYLLYISIQSETQYIKISTLCNSDTLSEVRYRPDKGWSRVLIVRNLRSNVELTSIWFFCSELKIWCARYSITIKLPKFDLLDTICIENVDTFVISTYIYGMWLTRQCRQWEWIVSVSRMSRDLCVSQWMVNPISYVEYLSSISWYSTCRKLQYPPRGCYDLNASVIIPSLQIYIFSTPLIRNIFSICVSHHRWRSLN